MATMNKPASGSTTWYQNITDNWTSVETNLVDKNIVAAKGDLVAATGASTPTRLPLGEDLAFLRADSSKASGLAWSRADALSSQDVIDVLWGKKFFSDGAFLPSTKMFEYLGTPATFAGTAGTATWTREPGVYRPDNSGIGWYDLGALKSKILVVVSTMMKISSDIAVMLSSAAPSTVDPDGYSMWNTSSGPIIRKRQAGAYTRLDSGTGFGNVDYRCGYALYYDDASNALKVFLRFGGQWFLAQSASNSSFTTMRYVSFRSAVANQRWITPFVCYAQ